MRKPTLSEILALGVLGLVLTLAVLFSVVFQASRRTVIESAQRLREHAGREIGDRVTHFLAQAPETVEVFQEEIRQGLLPAGDGAAIERALQAALLARPEIGEISFTFGRKTGVNAAGNVELAPDGRGQWSVIRTGPKEGGEQLASRHVYEEGDGFVADRRALASDGTWSSAQRQEGVRIEDPTAHLTFVTPAREENERIPVWSDLHWSQLDSSLPEYRRRVEMSVQRVITDRAGAFAGVLRVGLLAAQLDEAVHLPMGGSGAADPHVIFLCDHARRLVTRGVSGDPVSEVHGELRVMPSVLPPAIIGAMTNGFRKVSEQKPVAASAFARDGVRYLATFRELPNTRDWIAGVVAPESFYLGKLTSIRDRLLVAALVIMAMLVAAGTFIVRAVERGQRRIIAESSKMNALEFAPASTDSPFQDVSDVLESLEKAKTAMRAMGKYVPVDLVRRLYRERSEPVLGGRSMEISIMFTDIRGFTGFAEELAPAMLADALGRYLDMMARIIQQENRGTIDKYIGDAIMTIWNAPEAVAQHEVMACRAALRCRDAGLALTQSAEWNGRPVFETRFGLHAGEALVGHFGAHDRMNYTAIGDAVNLASRLEGLNKHYGTSIITSESIVEKAGEEFAFRLLDFVAVKGKSRVTRIYELVGKKGELPPAAVAYERAFAAYREREFGSAMAILEGQRGDPPSAVLWSRCRAYLEEPPPADWSGEHISMEK